LSAFRKRARSANCELTSTVSADRDALLAFDLGRIGRSRAIIVKFAKATPTGSFSPLNIAGYREQTNLTIGLYGVLDGMLLPVVGATYNHSDSLSHEFTLFPCAIGSECSVAERLLSRSPAQSISYNTRRERTPPGSGFA
jgi:hypothetical protein